MPNEPERHAAAGPDAEPAAAVPTSGAAGRASLAGGLRPGTARGSVAHTVAPPWHGGVNVGLLFGSAAWVITYTLLPLPGQRSVGDWNYVGAVVLFVTAMVLTRVMRVAAMRRFRAERSASAAAARIAPATQEDPSTT